MTLVRSNFTNTNFFFSKFFFYQRNTKRICQSCHTKTRQKCCNQPILADIFLYIYIFTYIFDYFWRLKQGVITLYSKNNQLISDRNKARRLIYSGWQIGIGRDEWKVSALCAVLCCPWKFYTMLHLHVHLRCVYTLILIPWTAGHRPEIPNMWQKQNEHRDVDVDFSWKSASKVLPPVFMYGRQKENRQHWPMCS